MVRIYYDAPVKSQSFCTKYTVQGGAKFMVRLIFLSFFAFFFFFLLFAFLKDSARSRDDTRISKLGCCRVLCQFQLTFHCINIFPSVWYPANNPIRNFPNVCEFLSVSTVHFIFSKYKLVAIHLLLLLCLNLLLS